MPTEFPWRDAAPEMQVVFSCLRWHIEAQPYFKDTKSLPLFVAVAQLRPALRTRSGGFETINFLKRSYSIPTRCANFLLDWPARL